MEASGDSVILRYCQLGTVKTGRDRHVNADFLGGAVLLGLGTGALVWVRRQEREAHSSGLAIACAARDDPLAKRLDAYARAKRLRPLDQIAAFGAGCTLVGLLLVFSSLAMPQGQVRASDAAIAAVPGTKATVPGQSGSATLVPQQVPGAPLAQDGDATGGLLPTTMAFIAAGGLAMVVGALLLGLASGRWAKSVGTAMIAVGLAANGYLVKEVKFGDIFKFNTRIDKVGIEVDFRNKLAELAQFGPEQLQSFDDFDSGRAEIRPHMKDALDSVCARWKAQGGRDQRGVLLVIGSTDRMRLAAATLRQYESNVGLARARAESVRTSLVEQCDVPPSQLVTLVSGPRHTPTDVTILPAGEAAKDRSVAVWALWSVPNKK